MRGLSPEFFESLRTGVLRPLLERVHMDRTLCLEIRTNYLNIYYRGGSLMRLGVDSKGYVATFEEKYAKGEPLELPGREICSSENLEAWLSALPRLKLAMDFWFSQHPKEEREIQQLMARDNNVGSVSRATDYYVCDMEYANGHGRFDIVAVHWPSTPAERRKGGRRRLVVGELKHGDGALKGRAGLHKHVLGVDGFLSDRGRLADLKEEMVTVFNQKRALGLVNCGRDLRSFSDEPPLFLLLLANHDPEKTRLREELATLPSPEHCEIRIAGSSLIGYGLFDPCLISVADALAMPETRL